MGGTSRNAPCPCGSGKKYKHCHLIKEEEVAEKAQRIQFGPLIIGLLLGGAVGAGMGMWKGATLGFAVGSATLILTLIVSAVASPPPPGEGGDPGAINFGTSKK